MFDYLHGFSPGVQAQCRVQLAGHERKPDAALYHIPVLREVHTCDGTSAW